MKGRAVSARRKRVWVEHVEPELKALRVRLRCAEAGHHLTPSQKAAARGVRKLIKRAENAVDRKDPYPTRVGNWWRGTLVEAAYRNLHAARAQIVTLYDKNELSAEIPRAISRANATLHRDDPRLVTASYIKALPTIDEQRAWIRQLTEDCYDASDFQHAQLRGFRNILLCAAIVISLLLSVAVVLIAINPTWVPLCFPAVDVNPTVVNSDVPLNCPTASHTSEPSSADVIVVGLIGLLGGALATSIAIRNISRASPISYDVPVALAWLKVPLGAFVAILGIVAVRGGFVPGLSRLDSQEQILAYALLFGFAQQLLTRSLDSKAKSLVEDLPSKDEPVTPSTGPTPEPAQPAAGQSGPSEPNPGATGTGHDGSLGPIVN
jgi:hypothetical protein